MLTAELMAQVRQLELRSRRAVNEVFAGEYVSAFKGRGMEFSEVRAYQPGDDIRTIDWNVTARAGEPFVKRYIEERELTVMLVCDVSASGAFGSVRREKRELAAEINALLAMVALSSSDKVGLLTFDAGVRSFVPPRKGRNHGLRVIRTLIEPHADPTDDRDERARRRLLFGRVGPATDTRPTDPMPALEHLGRFLKKRAIVVMVSDFLFPPLAGAGAVRARGDGGGALRETALAQSLRMLSAKHDLVMVKVADPRESELPPVGLVELVDPETGGRRMVDTSSRRVRRMVAAEAAAHADRVQTLAESCRGDLLEVSTSRPYLNDLAELFRTRERRRAR
jgi:uncharacterized protein (DUF58 family)